MEGMCGNMDGDASNDWRECFTGTEYDTHDAAAMMAIASSCEHGELDGEGYIGGTKLDESDGNNENDYDYYDG